MENLVALAGHFKNKRVFITGHTGFKGSWLMAWLNLWNAKVRGYALPPDYDNNIYNYFIRNKKVETVLADIRDKNRLRKEILDFDPDFIFHLAAQPLVRRSYEIPAETFEINVAGTANLLESVKDLPGRCTVIVVTTDKVYENHEKEILYKEEDVLGGYDPYSASKACAELVVSSFRNSFFNPDKIAVHKKSVVSIRAGNVIGGGDQSTDRLIPDIVRSLNNNNVIEIRSPNAVRPWQHVLEPLAGYLLVAAMLNEKPTAYSPAYNFGPNPDDHLKVKEFVEAAIASWGSGQWKDCTDPKQPHEAGLLKLDISKAKKELKWQPKLTSREAIKWTIDWYKQDTSKQVEYTFRQINDYLAL